MAHDQELDASGLNCPLPILRAKKTLNAMAAGQVLHVIATDPGSVRDFDAFAALTPFPWERVAILDDVLTTGSTVNELTRVLRRAGARSVEVWAVARTP